MKQITFNIHRGHGIKDLHTIRQEVKPIKSDWKEKVDMTLEIKTLTNN